MAIHGDNVAFTGFAYTPATKVIIAAGVANLTTANVKMEGEGAASDNLDTIHWTGQASGSTQGLVDGQQVAIRPFSASHDIVIKHNTGNILCPGASDVTLAELGDMATLQYNAGAAKWTVVAVSTLAGVPLGSSYLLLSGGTMTGTGILMSDTIPLKLGTNSDLSLASSGTAVTFTGLAITGGGAGAATASLAITTGIRTKNDNNAGVPASGALSIASGATSQTTAAATGGASGATSVRSGATNVTFAAATGGASGAFTAGSGDTDISAAVAAQGGASGTATFKSGDALSTGATATSGNSGAAVFQSGVSADGNSGNVTVGAGTAGGTQGSVAVTGSAVTFTNNPTIDLGTGAKTIGGTALTSTGILAWTTKANDAASLTIGPAAVADSIKITSTTATPTVSIKNPILRDALTDPGTGVAIPVHRSFTLPLTIGSAGAETNTMAIPTALGQKALICVDVVGSGTRVVTVASAINVTGNNTITFATARQSLLMESIQVGGVLAWQVMVNNGTVSLSTV
jgi:hypothetical protein